MPSQLNLFDGLIVDNFAGGGGASTGIELALGRPVDIAINHDKSAIVMHQANHPFTRHYCESVWDIDPVKATNGQPVTLAWFSPDCKHFSKARGGRPADKSIRGLAWIAIKWAKTTRPRVIMLENVEEFVTWGPLDGDGMPDKARSGETFNRFVTSFIELGYDVEWRELKASDYGAPTIRKRLFLIARCDGQPIVWPEPTHGDPRTPAVKNKRLKPWRTAAEIIDWSLPCPSIFDTAEEIMAKYGVRAVRPLAEATLRRIARGLKKFVFDNPKPFVVQCHTGHRENDFGATGEPLKTILTRPEMGLVVPYTRANTSNCVGQPADEPTNAIRSNGSHMLVTPYAVSICQNSGGDRTRPADEPLNTTVSKAEQCVVAPTLIQYHAERHDGEVRGQDTRKPMLTVDGSNRYGVAAATLIQTGYGEAPGQQPRAPGLDKPLGTVVSGGKHAAVTAFMTKYYGDGQDGNGSKADAPLGTATPWDHNALVASSIAQFNHDDAGQPTDKPLHTVVASPGHLGEVRAFLAKYYGTVEAQGADDPLHTITSKDRFGLVTVQGEQYAIVDIGLRMLTPRELFSAQGFPPDYVIDIGADGKPISKAAQVARCGNSVCPALAEALVRANLPEQCGKKIKTMAKLKQEVAA